jgi:hypothetical protein
MGAREQGQLPLAGVSVLACGGGSGVPHVTVSLEKVPV